MEGVGLDVLSNKKLIFVEIYGDIKSQLGVRDKIRIVDKNPQMAPEVRNNN